MENYNLQVLKIMFKFGLLRCKTWEIHYPLAARTLIVCLRNNMQILDQIWMHT
jgi:hypothetical protein